MRALGARGEVRLRSWWQECVLVVLVCVVAAMSMNPPVSGDAATRFTLAGFILPAAGGVSLLCRRRAPWWTLAALTLVTVGSQAAGHAALPFIPALIVAMYHVARCFDRKPAWTAALVVMVCLLTASMAWGSGPLFGPQRVVPLTWVGLATAIGYAARIRHAYVIALEERALRAERTQEEEAERRVAEERLRIARELHDVVAHELTLITTQAGVALHLGERTPTLATESLRSIRDGSKQALDELRTMVGLLSRPGDDADPLRDPVPGLDRVGELVQSFAHAGLKVEVEREGERQPVPMAVDVAAYRIVQEALTNVCKHAGAGTARVRLGFAHDSLRVTVENGPPAVVSPVLRGLDAGGTGRGLISIRERSAAVGGRATIGPDSSGGFVVEVRLPLGRARDTGREAE
ncbi:sensor histidine kinase [Streptomyces sp. NPDC007901]|uniref:sensor histidine kinase n=1 Tax=Streptomyces sp. NPDC007901 TaxID=3364785 RepID=UPI0036EBBA62